ncbi:MAG: hypothetical protein FWH18_02110 [Marinilabiliaceae bacterium]|nr:hypothetical protein [Marinilabiliaceae bacterium]
MDDEEFEKYLKDIDKIKIDFISAYNHEIQSIIGLDLQQLLVVLFYRGDTFVQKEIQEYCYKILKEKDLLVEEHKGDYRNIHLLEDSKYL